MKRRFTKAVVIVIMVAILGLMMSGCVPKNAEDAKDKLKEKGYIATILTDLASMQEDGVVGVIVAVNTASGDAVTAIWFETRKQAKANFSIYKEQFEKEFDTKAKIEGGISGKCIFIGTPQGVKDFK